MHKLLPALLILIIFASMASCSLEMIDEVDPVGIGTEIPDLAMRNIRHTLVRGGNPILLLYADEVLVFTGSNRRDMKSVRFEQYGSDGVLEATGTAGTASQNIKTEDVDFTDGIVLEILREGSFLEAPYLRWAAETKIFSSKPEDTVIMKKGRLTQIEGKGFALDTLSRKLSFSGESSGTLAVEDE